MIDRFKALLQNTFKELKDHKFLIACSGGLDSVVLTHLCHQSDLNFELAHCNFKLRIPEADADEKFVQELSRKYGRLCHVRTIAIPEKRKAHTGSIQMIARDLRYQWFLELLEERGLTFVLTAHHLDDSLETFFINLARGTGLTGLTGIPAKTNHIRRPLLGFTREEILQYAREEDLQWQEDSSNSDDKYLRNRIRKVLVPELKEISTAFPDTFIRTRDSLEASDKILAKHIRNVRDKLFEREKNTWKISIAGLLTLEPLTPYLFELFQDFGFGNPEQIKALLPAMSGKELHSEHYRLLKDREFLLLQAHEESEKEIIPISLEAKGITYPIALKWEEAAALETGNAYTLWVDKQTLNDQLVLRKWRKGDYFYPLGMQGKKKLSKYFKDEKMSVFDKENQWLLCSGPEIVWVVGRRADHRFRVQNHSSQILKFEYVP